MYLAAASVAGTRCGSQNVAATQAGGCCRDIVAAKRLLHCSTCSAVHLNRVNKQGWPSCRPQAGACRRRRWRHWRRHRRVANPGRRDSRRLTRQLLSSGGAVRRGRCAKARAAASPSTLGASCRLRCSRRAAPRPRIAASKLISAARRSTGRGGQRARWGSVGRDQERNLCCDLKLDCDGQVAGVAARALRPSTEVEPRGAGWQESHRRSPRSQGIPSHCTFISITHKCSV